MVNPSKIQRGVMISLGIGAVEQKGESFIFTFNGKKFMVSIKLGEVSLSRGNNVRPILEIGDEEIVRKICSIVRGKEKF